MLHFYSCLTFLWLFGLAVLSLDAELGLLWEVKGNRHIVTRRGRVPLNDTTSFSPCTFWHGLSLPEFAQLLVEARIRLGISFFEGGKGVSMHS